MARFIQYEGRAWRLSEMSSAYSIKPATLYRRLERFGETATGITRALCTGIMTREAAGRRGAMRSPWRVR